DTYRLRVVLHDGYPVLNRPSRITGYGHVDHAVAIEIAQGNAGVQHASEPRPSIQLEGAVAVAGVNHRRPETVFSAIFCFASCDLERNRQIQLPILVEIAGANPVRVGSAARITLCPRVELVSGAHRERSIAVSCENREGSRIVPTGER